jgi:hypothetical protein
VAIAARLSRHPNRSLVARQKSQPHDQDEAPSGVENCSRNRARRRPVILCSRTGCVRIAIRSRVAETLPEERATTECLIAENALTASDAALVSVPRLLGMSILGDWVEFF